MSEVQFDRVQSPRIKVCNLAKPSEVDILLNQRVDIAGFRILSAELGDSALDGKLNALRYASEREIKTAVTIDKLDVVLLERLLAGISVDFLCLHFSPSPEELDNIKTNFPRSKISRLLAYEDVDKYDKRRLYSDVDYTLFDWKRGGTGIFPDLDIFERYDLDSLRQRAMIAGGLNSVNVVRLLEVAIPYGLDLDSSVRDPLTREIDERRVERFVRAVRQTSKSSEQGSPEPDAVLPFARVNKRPWSVVTDRVIDSNRVVANTRLISIVDDSDRYRNAVDSVSQRIFNSLGDLARHPEVKQRWLNAALVALSSCLYFPREMLNSTLRYLHMKVASELKARSAGSNDFHLFSNDPGALHEDYFRINEIHGRLDQDKHARIKGIEDLGNNLSDLRHTSESQRVNSKLQLRMILERPVWVLLADQSLSGHSLSGDLEKILWVFEKTVGASRQRGVVLALCQIMTITALNALMQIPSIKRAIRQGYLVIDSAIYLSSEYSVLSSNSCQIRDPDMRSDLVELCEWFSQEFVLEDPRLARMLRKSGDNMAFGYRKAGLLMARQENCPTDSLPLLWYEGVGRSGHAYKGPFRRVHSRIDEQAVESTNGLWKEIRRDDELCALLQSLSAGAGEHDE